MNSSTNFLASGSPMFGGPSFGSGSLFLNIGAVD